MEFAVLANHGMKIKENEKRDKFLDLARELKKLWNMRVTVIPIVIDALGTIPKGFVKGTRKFRNQRMCGEHPNNSFIKIRQNTEESSADLLSLRLQWKTLANAGGKKLVKWW